MAEENNNGEAVVPGADVPSGEGEPNVNVESLSLEDINKDLGRDFKTIEDAQKGISDTFKFVGKAGTYQSVMKELTTSLGMDESGVVKHLQTLAGAGKPPVEEKPKPEIDPEGFVSKEQYDRDMFFKDNPKYEPVKALINDMSKAHGKTAAEVIEMDAFKDVFTKVEGFDQTQGKKSVLESNPRLNAAKDKVTNAKTSINEATKARVAGDAGAANAHEAQARKDVVGAVMDVYNIGGESEEAK